MSEAAMTGVDRRGHHANAIQSDSGPLLERGLKRRGGRPSNGRHDANRFKPEDDETIRDKRLAPMAWLDCYRRHDAVRCRNGRDMARLKRRTGQHQDCRFGFSIRAHPNLADSGRDNGRAP